MGDEAEVVQCHFKYLCTDTKCKLVSYTEFIALVPPGKFVGRNTSV